MAYMTMLSSLPADGGGSLPRLLSGRLDLLILLQLLGNADGLARTWDRWIVNVGWLITETYLLPMAILY